MSLLRIEQLRKQFGELVVTNNVTLAVEEGERHAIIGPNGAGKTSLLHQIGGQMKPTSGRILLHGDDIAGLAPEAICRRGVARTFQRNNLFPSLTIAENVRLAAETRHGSPYDCFTPVRRRQKVRARVTEALERVHLAAAPDRIVSKISYGEQRQLEIAIALAGAPRLLLLDEPTSGMGPAETDRMIDLVASLPRDLAIILIEHDMNVVFSVADRVTVLYYGEVLATGTPAEIRDDQRVRDVYLGTAH
jgi:branched-chain amino acid transport system ATP-binding protein